jgi:REP element-mobilizing transposase RayT
VHVTMKLRAEVGNLRTGSKAKVIRKSIAAATIGAATSGAGATAAVRRNDFRVVDWSIQGNHIHLVVEAVGSVRLSREMQGLSVRIARGLNGKLDRQGSVFADRYHARILKTPREVRNAKAYVLLNARRHAVQRGRSCQRNWMDPYSSWAWFDGWKDCSSTAVHKARAGPDKERCGAAGKTWLMRVGWRRYGLISINEVPGRR